MIRYCCFLASALGAACALAGAAIAATPFNGPDCDCTVRDGTADPVTVPEGARFKD